MIIAPAIRTDAAEILALQRLAYASEGERYAAPDMPPLVETLAALEARFTDHVFLKVVDTTGRIVGSVRAVRRDGTCLIGRLMVHPDHQRQGLGRALLTAIEQRFPDAACFELFTGHRSAHQLRLYRFLGYVEFKREAVSDTVDLVFLEKDGHLRKPFPEASAIP